MIRDRESVAPPAADSSSWSLCIPDVAGMSLGLIEGAETRIMSGPTGTIQRGDRPEKGRSFFERCATVEES
jgi:hypothetical protein